MKAITAVCATGASVPAITSGRIQRHRDGENAEIQMYLSKLQDLVPFMPKNRKISKLEVIQHVIDYICDLQTALENHPAVGQFDAETALVTPCEPVQKRRKPLGPRPAPNTILRKTPSTTPAEHRNHPTVSFNTHFCDVFPGKPLSCKLSFRVTAENFPRVFHVVIKCSDFIFCKKYQSDTQVNYLSGKRVGLARRLRDTSYGTKSK